ncbi:hypothetical protein BAUCODRAFT_123603 [Baudoinia panamericana UAMH 10762]|uniref:Uncharacterized protein n=1 Tax=Baudoinia panamericana (strain UAMH 10762) TaxID=717646 RepID=M2N7T0_BAUPA|nr:uncharacterized protein BAUCODRAFT_123603 [Baudoinia panamericana UAMH 10762]EMC95129.1 hypothetical protein BAUCODRAFT_123603 [Baudoinia panamericana UAMH 10762]
MPLGKAYSEEQKLQVRSLLEAGRDEEAIEKDTGVSDRTVRRWKLELERTGRIGKPPESRTGRHRVLNADVEAALFDYVQGKDMSVDDMLWWLYDTYKIVVGTRTIRRVFERKGDKIKLGTPRGANLTAPDNDDNDGNDGNEDEPPDQQDVEAPLASYQSPYAPIANNAEQQLAQALQQHAEQTYDGPVNFETELPEDEETIQLQLQQIALQRREVELKLQMKRLQKGKKGGKKGSPSTSVLYNPSASASADTPKRDSRSKKKIEEARRRTAERQERMLRDLERRSRRRDHLTAEWVESKDIWPLRAQSVLANLMHQYGCYSFSHSNVQTFEQMYSDLYTLVDHEKGDWSQPHHDELLRERMKRKVAQLRSKMAKTGEIVGRGDAYGGWQRAENYTGEAAGDAEGDDTEIPIDSQLQQQGGAQQPGQQQQVIAEQPSPYAPMVNSHHHLQQPQQQQPTAQMSHTQGMPYQYPMLPYAMNGQSGMPSQEGMVL